jgi:branched-subunit amino acid ABC-type transport system permease component
VDEGTGVISILEFGLIGLATGAIFALIAQGAVLVYRGSGLLNLAQGAFAMVGAYLFFTLHVQQGLPSGLSLAVSVAVCALGGALLHLGILRSMRKSSSLARVVAILAVVVVLQSGAYLIYGQYPKTTTSLISTRTVFLLSGDRLPIAIDALAIIGIAIGLTIALTVLYRYTSAGRLTAAVAESELIVGSLGHSPDVVAALNWGLGSALAGFAGILIAPSIALEPTGLVLLVIPALAAALVGQFKSFPVTLVTALAIGVAESEITKYVSTPGWPDAAPLLVVIAILSVRGDGLPLRSFVLDRLPRVGTGRVRVIPTAIAYVLMIVWVLSSGPDWAAAITTTVSYAIICLSVIVVTGYAGQLSLGQYALAGLAALIAARLALHLPFLAAVVIAVIATAAIGGILGVPALRTRGATLAIVTLGLGGAIVDLFLVNGNYTGGPGGITPPIPHIFGIDLDPFLDPHRYALLFSLWRSLLASQRLTFGVASSGAGSWPCARTSAARQRWGSMSPDRSCTPSPSVRRSLR